MKLQILWTNDNLDTIENMIVMYSVASIRNKFWEDVNVIIWGASAKLISENLRVQTLVRYMIEEGVTVEACKACADKYNASQLIENLGVTVRYMGAPMTEYLKDENVKLLTI